MDAEEIECIKKYTIDTSSYKFYMIEPPFISYDLILLAEDTII
jgi:hypothetical protein